MSEDAKKCTENISKVIGEIPTDKKEMAVRLTESYIAGLATGMELAAGNNGAPHED